MTFQDHVMTKIEERDESKTWRAWPRERKTIGNGRLSVPLRMLEPREGP